MNMNIPNRTNITRIKEMDLVQPANLAVTMNGSQCFAGHVNRHPEFSLKYPDRTTVVRVVVGHKQRIHISDVPAVFFESLLG